jgi:uncharacterized membrane-anchored protein
VFNGIILVSKTSTFGVLLRVKVVLVCSSAIASWMLLWVVLIPTFINKKMLSFMALTIIGVEKLVKFKLEQRRVGFCQLLCITFPINLVG